MNLSVALLSRLKRYGYEYSFNLLSRQSRYYRAIPHRCELRDEKTQTRFTPSENENLENFGMHIM